MAESNRRSTSPAGFELPLLDPPQPTRRGPRRLTPAERQRRRTALAQLISNGQDAVTRVEVMRAQFQMSKHATISLTRRLLEEWAEHDREMEPIRRQATQHRVHRELLQATAAGAWNAVAQLEKVLMEVQGTAAPTQHVVTSTVRMSESLERIIGDLSAEEVRRLVNQALLDAGPNADNVIPLDPRRRRTG